MNLSKQSETVYEYIRSHLGCTMLDTINGTRLPYAPDRIAELRRGGVPIIIVGQRNEAEGRASKQFAIREGSLDTPIPGLLSDS